MTRPSHTPNGYDPAWVHAINQVLEDRECDVRILDISDDLWARFIGSMCDAIEHGEFDDLIVAEGDKRLLAVAPDAPTDNYPPVGLPVSFISSQYGDNAVAILDGSGLKVGETYGPELADWIVKELNKHSLEAQGIHPDDEPEIDDSVKCCPECEKPNQFGEVCQSCKDDLAREEWPLDRAERERNEDQDAGLEGMPNYQS